MRPPNVITDIAAPSVCFHRALQPCMPLGDTVSGPSSVHGTGLFAARDLPARHLLGHFVGEALTQSEYARRRAAGGAHCLVQFTNLDGEGVRLDGTGCSDLALVNSVSGTAELANVEFVCDGVALEAITLVSVKAGAELLANYELVLPRRNRSTPAMPPLPAVRCVPAAEFLKRLEHAVLGEGAGGLGAPWDPMHEPVCCAAESPGSPLAEFTASFGAAASLAEAVVKLGVKTPGRGQASLESVSAGSALSASVPKLLLEALLRADLAKAVPVLTAFLGRGDGASAGAELGAELCSCVVVVLAGKLRVWVADATLENAVLYGVENARRRHEFSDVQEAELGAGGVMLVTSGSVWQMACAGNEAVAVAVDFAAPAAGWDVAAQMAWRLLPARDKGTRRAAAAAVAACFSTRDETADAALKALRSTYWGERLGLV